MNIKRKFHCFSDEKLKIFLNSPLYLEMMKRKKIGETIDAK
jgi:hypothetical protein